MDEFIKYLFKDHASRGFVWVVFIIFLVVENGPSWINALKENKKPPQVIGITTTAEQKNEVQEITETPCYSFLPLNEIDISVELDQITPKNGLFYPTGGGNTWEGVVWITKQIDPNFKKIYIEYEIVPDDKSKKPASFIWSVARTTSENKRQIITKIWVPEYSLIEGTNIPQLLGFAKNIDYEKNQLERELPLSLPDAVKLRQTDSLSIEPTNINGNEMMINFTYNFTSNRTSIALPYPFSKKVSFPFSNLKDSNEKLDLGLGTYVGNGLRIISLQACY